MQMELVTRYQLGRRSKLLCSTTTLPSLNKPDTPKKEMSKCHLSNHFSNHSTASNPLAAAPLHRLSKRIRQLRGTPRPCGREAPQKAPCREQRAQVAAQSWDGQSLVPTGGNFPRKGPGEKGEVQTAEALWELFGDSRKLIVSLIRMEIIRRIYVHWCWKFLTPHYRKSAHTVYENWRVPVG